MPRGKNTVVIEYVSTSAVNAGDVVALEVSPLLRSAIITRRLTRIPHSIDRDQSPGRSRSRPYRDLPALHLPHSADEVVTTGYWYNNFEFPKSERGDWITGKTCSTR